VAIAQGFATQILMGFESTPGVLPGTPTGSKIPGSNLAISPKVNQFTSDAMTGVSRARPWIAGKIGADGSFDIECNRDSLDFPLKSLFDQVTHAGTAGWYDHYFAMGNQLPPSFYYQEGHTDIGQYLLYLGNQMSIWKAQVMAEGLMKSSWTPVGLSMTPFSTTQITGTITDKTGANPLSYLTATLTEGGAVLAYGTQVDWTLDRKMKRVEAIDGTNKGYAVIQGALPTIQVNLTAFFPDAVLLNKAINSTETSLSCLIPAVESGHGMKIKFPTGKYLPTGIPASGQGELTIKLAGMFYGRGAASNIGGEALSKFFTTVTITAATNDILKIKVDGLAAQSFTLTPGASRTLAQIVTDLAALTGATAVAENGRVLIVSTMATGTGSTSSIQIDATGTAQATLGFDTVLHAGWDAVDFWVRLSNANVTV
jgi:tail tube protein